MIVRDFTDRSCDAMPATTFQQNKGRLSEIPGLIVVLVSFSFISLAQPSRSEVETPSGALAGAETQTKQLLSWIPEKRAYAARQLGAKGKEATSAIPFLVRILNDSTPVLWPFSPDPTTPGKEARSALVKIGEPAVSTLISVLVEGDPRTQENAAKTLAGIGQPAVEALLAALKSQEASLRAQAAWALGIAGDSRTVKPLVESLKDKQAIVRAKATGAVGNFQDPFVVEPLIEALKDKDSEVRKAAACSLGAIHDPRTKDALIATLHDSNIDVSLQAIWALKSKRGRMVVEALLVIVAGGGEGSSNHAADTILAIADEDSLDLFVDALRKSKNNWRVGDTAAKAMAKIGRPAVGALMDALKHEEHGIRFYAVEALGKIKDPRALEPLKARLNDDDPMVRQAAAKAILAIEADAAKKSTTAEEVAAPSKPSKAQEDFRTNQPTVATLLNRLLENDAVTRWTTAVALDTFSDPRKNEDFNVLLDAEDEKRIERMVAVALGEIRDANVLRPLMAAVFNRHTRRKAVDRLAQLGPTAVDALIGALRDPDWGIRRQSVWALGRIGDPRAAEPMIALMGDPEFEVYRIVPDEVAKLGESAVAALIAGLNSGNHMIRRGSAQSLANLNDRRSVEPLITALRDNDSVVREWVCKALGNLKDPRAVEPLITYLKDKSVYESEKRQGIYALGEIADPRAAEVLVDFVNYQSRGGEVARALARIGDPAIPYLLQDKKKLPAIMPILAKIGTPASLGQLVKMITEGDRTVSEMAAHTLAEGIVDPEATEALIPLLKNENPIVRRSAVRALLGIKDPRAVEPLLAAMKDSDPFVRYQAVYTLGFLDDRRAIEPIVEVLRSSDPNLQHVAAESLERITGKDYGVNYSQWKEWLEENRQM